MQVFMLHTSKIRIPPIVSTISQTVKQLHLLLTGSSCKCSHQFSWYRQPKAALPWDGQVANVADLPLEDFHHKNGDAAAWDSWACLESEDEVVACGHNREMDHAYVDDASKDGGDGGPEDGGTAAFRQLQ